MDTPAPIESPLQTSSTLPTAPSNNASAIKSKSKQLCSSLALLKGSTDEQVFAGLLMLTKHVKPEEFKRFRGLILSEMKGGHFLGRVLKSGLAKDETNADLYLRLGLAVASTFCKDISCARQLIALLPMMEQVVLDEQGKRGSELRLQALQCCFDVLLAQEGLKKPAAFEDTRLHSPVIALANLFETATIQQRSALFEPFFVMAKLGAADCKHLATLYEKRRDDIGTSAARVILAKLDRFMLEDTARANLQPAQIEALSATVQPLASGVFHVLRSFNTAPDDDRSMAFRVAEVLCRVAGPGWPGMAEPTNTKTKTPSKTREALETNVKILAHLVSVEVTADLTHLRYELLETNTEVDEDSTAPTATTTVNPKPNRLNDEEIRMKVEEVVVCLHLIEHLINFLTTEEPEELAGDEGGFDQDLPWSGFSVETLMALRQALIETFTTVTGFLELCVDAKVTSNNTEQFLWIVQSCVRCSANWLQEETDQSLEIRDRTLTTLATLLAAHPKALVNPVSPVLVELAPICTISPRLCSCLVDQILISAQDFTESLPATNAYAYNRAIQIASFLIERSPTLVGHVHETWGHGCVELLLAQRSDLPLDVAGCLLCVMALGKPTDALPRYTKRLLGTITDLSKQGWEEERIAFLQDTIRPYLLVRVLQGG